MSGIVGYFGKQINHNDHSLINSMVEEIKYVEQDTVDIYKDDISSIATVHHGLINKEKQPIYNEDKSLFIVMSGEVYGYEDDKRVLREKGYSFKYDDNDAEFCLHLYEEYGDDAFIKLNGCFLIVIYNVKEKELIIANDRFSSCPLFYYSGNGSLIYGSQLKAVIASDQVPRSLNFQAIAEFFTFQRVLDSKTYYEDVKVLKPAHILKFKNGNAAIRKYWQIKYFDGQYKDEDYYVEAIMEALKRSIQRRSSDNLRYGILLSGGVDSRTILAAAECPITAFTIANYENREVQIARAIAKAKGCEHIYLHRDYDYYANIVERSVNLGDGMISYQHGHFSGFIPDILKHCDILFYGYAFDIFFKGNFMPANKIKIMNKTIALPTQKTITDKNLMDTVLSSLSCVSLWNSKPAKLFSHEYKDKYEGLISSSIESIVNEGMKHANNGYNIFDYLDLYFLAKNYGFMNRLSIKNFMDDRPISLDNDLLDLHSAIPHYLRWNGKVFIKALERLNPKIAAIPNSNSGVAPTSPVLLDWIYKLGSKLRSKIIEPKLPDKTFTRGSWCNLTELTRRNKILRELIGKVINDEEYIPSDVFDRNTLIDLYNKHINNQGDYHQFLLLTCTFGVWYKNYGPK